MKYFSIILLIIGSLLVLLYYAIEQNLFSFHNFYLQLSFGNSTYLSYLFWIGLTIIGLSLLLLFVYALHKKAILFRLKMEFYSFQESGDGKAFEEFLANLFKACGWKVTNPTSSTNASDQGIDLILDGKVAVQAKHYTNSTGNKAVQEVISGLIYWKKNGFPHLKWKAVVTTSYFTPQAVDLARSGNVILKEWKDIEELLNGKLSKKWILKMPQRFE
jgi:restriction system protein